MNVEEFMAGEVAKLRTRAVELRAWGATPAADTCVKVASELEASFRTWWLEELPVTLAASECGYSADRLREMCRDHEIPHQKGDGTNGHMRIARRDLPRKARRPGPDISAIEAKLLRKDARKGLRPAS